METKILVIGVVRKGNTVFLRKKPKGSPPYKQTWYLFHGELSSKDSNPEKVLKTALKKQTGISIKPIEKLSWDTEIKPDLKGTKTFYVYIDYLCEYVSGKLAKGVGIEKLEWVPISKLKNYDLVPPSVKLFKRMGYL